MGKERIQNKRSLLKLIKIMLDNYEEAESRIEKIQVNTEIDHAL